jgi:hypothetical protein
MTSGGILCCGRDGWGLGFVDPIGCGHRSIGGALNGNRLIQTWTSKAAAETGQNRLVHTDPLGKLAAGNVVGFEMVLKLVHALHFAQCAIWRQA